MERAKGKKIEINAGIFPVLVEVYIGDKKIAPECKDDTPGIGNLVASISLPRGAYLLYLQGLKPGKNDTEITLLEQYAYGVPFTDQDYKDIIGLMFVPVPRNTQITDFFERMGIGTATDDEGKTKFVLKEEVIPEIQASTWDCILIDLLHDKSFDIINCFDFETAFERKFKNTGGSDDLFISLGAYKFTADTAEQKLSNALRAAFMFTVVGYYIGLRVGQYNSFDEYFDAEFYKRVSLVHALWCTRNSDEDFKYLPLYESFNNIKNENKQALVNTLKAVLDCDFMALDDKACLKSRLIEGSVEIHNSTDATVVALKQALVKPAMNYILLREKAKESLESAKVLFNNGLYKDCANRCFYAMTFALKALLEDQGLLADWKDNELKESETHKLLESKLHDLVSNGILTQQDEIDFLSVKEDRWKCDYNIYAFTERDASECVRKMEDFYLNVEVLTDH